MSVFEIFDLDHSAPLTGFATFRLSFNGLLGLIDHSYTVVAWLRLSSQGLESLLRAATNGNYSQAVKGSLLLPDTYQQKY
jgi:hypothetical protein